jgi:hypothetical protein
MLARISLNLAQPWHQLDKIARPVAAIQLMYQNLVPSVLYSTIGAGQGEDIGAACQYGARARLDGRGADGLKAQHPEQLAKTRNILGLDAVECFGGYVSSGQAGAAGGDDAIDAVILDPGVEPCDDQFGVVMLYIAADDDMASCLNPLRQYIAAGIVVGGAGVRYRQQRDVYGFENAGFIDRQSGLLPKRWLD